MANPSNHRRPRFAALYLAALLPAAGCTGIPAFTLGQSDVPQAPVGPKVAALVANLKCELLQAANSDHVLPHYYDDPRLPPKTPPADPERKFTLHNIFKEIEYVGQVTFTLDVTDTGAFSPSESFTQIFKAATVLLPATTMVLSVGGGLSEAAHRQVTIQHSVDFSRLVTTETHPRHGGRRFTPPARVRPPPELCNNGVELGGKLGLEEVLATGLVAAAMNDISVFPQSENKDAAGSGPVKVDAPFAFGQIAAQVDFSITENVGGGPTWTLRHFNVGAGSGGLFSFNRQVADKVVVTFIPVCIREKYALRTRPDQLPYEYDPHMVDGTPGWANYLPQCAALPNHAQTVAEAVAKADYNNMALLLRSAVSAR